MCDKLGNHNLGSARLGTCLQLSSEEARKMYSGNLRKRHVFSVDFKGVVRSGRKVGPALV